MKRPRPPITDRVKLTVAFAQAINAGFNAFALLSRNDGETLKQLLERRLQFVADHVLKCPRSELRCDHNPPLRARPYNPRIKDVAARYTPNANDERYLFFRPQSAEYEWSHHIKTNVRGDGAQYPDRVLINRERRREKAASKGVRKWKSKTWPKRKLRGGTFGQAKKGKRRTSSRARKYVGLRFVTSGSRPRASSG